MDMKFYTNKISTGKSVGFNEFIEKLAKSNAAVTKTASSAAPATKEANAANFGDKKAPPFGAKGKKEEGEVTPEGHDDSEVETCDASAETEVKVAKEEKVNKDGEMHVKKQEMDPVGGTNTGKPEGEKKKESEAKADVKQAGKKVDPKAAKPGVAKNAPAAKVAPSKKASNDDVPPENKGRTHGPDECCGAPSSKGDDGSEGEKKKSESSEKKETEASSVRLVRIANLDAKTKNEWKTYWKALYPTEYVNAMFADK
jgi:hypothetical protein